MPIPSCLYILSRLADRVLDVSRKMEVCVDIGSGRGWVSRNIPTLNKHCRLRD